MASSRRPSGLRRANDPPLLILISLADGPRHGHALAKDIEGFAGVTKALADMRRITAVGLARTRLDGRLA